MTTFVIFAMKPLTSLAFILLMPLVGSCTANATVRASPDG